MSASWRFAAAAARRDLHRSFRGLRLLFLCLFLGVATLAAIGSLGASITGEIAAQGRVILGGDLQVGMSQREATAAEMAALRSAGTVSETIRMRAMARGAAGQAVLTELKGVDGLYPLYGALTLADGRTVRAPPPGQVYIGAPLAERLGLAPGSRIRFGDADFAVAGIIAGEPDRVGEGFTLGPVALTSIQDLRRTGLVQPGSLYSSRYRIRLSPGASAEPVIDRLRSRFPSASWEMRTAERAAPGASRFFDRLGQFLILVGLAALVIAGIGVSNGVSSYLRRKQEAIATLKALGATSGDIARTWGLQIGLVTLVAVAAGLAVGAVVPPLLVSLAGEALPVRPGLRLHLLPLATSAAFGFLIAFIFVLPPLSRARMQPVATLFREAVAEHGRTDRRALLLAALAATAILALVLLTSDEPLFSASVLGAIFLVTLLLAALGWAVRRGASRLPRPRNPLLRLALAALHRPGAQTGALVVALGLALTLFVTLAAVQTSLSAEIANSVPRRAPDQFVLDIPSDRQGEFEAIVRREAGAAEINIVPNLRGTITAFAGRRVADLESPPPGAWFLRGERGVTFSPVLPEGSDLTAGAWWPADYRGAPIVSIDEEAARILGIGVGDTLTVSVLGREIEARIASLRRINWDTMGFNYILVFPPSVLADAPHNLAATISLEPGREAALTRALLDAFPSASVIEVGEVIRQVTTLLGQMSTAILVAASVAILAGIAVLIGAIAASRQARAYDSVVLRTLGATRAQILAVQAVEYALLALVVAGLSLALGIAGAWFVIVRVFEFDWAPDWGIVAATLLAGGGLTLGIALIGSIPLLSVRPARALRRL